MPSIHVNLGHRSYKILLHHAAAAQFPAWLDSLTKSKSVCLIYDRHVKMHATALSIELQKTGITAHQVQVPSGENQKSLEGLSKLYDELAALKADRSTPILALGGGVIGDLAGFAAATFNRGLPVIMIPTTLLAMVDSSVGGKVGINHQAGKNLIGAFHQPRGVWIDTQYLSTLPPREYCSGMAEVIKYGMILDAAFFQWLEEHVEAILQLEPAALDHLITRSCELKAQVVEQDEYETTGLRALLNFGHTCGHAFEKVAGYGRLLHGEAVAIGMVCECRLAEKLGMIDDALTQRLIKLLSRFQLPTAVSRRWSVDAMVEAMRHDKKNVGGKMRFVLPTRLGEVQAGYEVEAEIVQQLLRRDK
ncbi:MAG TPA: 3-dehydroquinate synthase [Gemmatales bacterium]|nr:3-dehydroquinate synthase [Gemmatales bacterium]